MSGPMVSIWRSFQPTDRPARWREIVARIAAEHGIKVEDILSSSRAREFAWPRCQAYAEIRLQTGMSWPAIARNLNRDHTTCLTGARRHWARVAAAYPQHIHNVVNGFQEPLDP